MKNHLYKAALVAALGMAGAMAAHAQSPANNDLVLGFTSQASGVSDDYLIDLGQLPASPGVFNISSSFSASTFNSVFGSALSSGAVNVGVVGGLDGTPGDVIDSTLDTSATPSATVAGSIAPLSASGSTIDGAAGEVAALTLGTPSHGAIGSFYQNVAENTTTAGGQPNSYAGYVANPLSTITGSSIVLDLWKDTFTGRSVSGWTYEGYVDLSFSGDNLTASFDEVQVVPEPTTYGIFGIGLLLLGLGRRFTRKTA